MIGRPANSLKSLSIVLRASLLFSTVFLIGITVLGASQVSPQGKTSSVSIPPYLYRIFSSRDSAATYFHRYDSDILARQSSGLPRRIVPFTDSRYLRLDAAVEKIFREFQRLFPEKLGPLKPPPAILIEDNSRNAYALGPRPDDPHKSIPYFFVVHTGFASDPLSDSQYYGVLAHELAHLLKRHANPDVVKKLTKVYRSTNAVSVASLGASLVTSEALGFLQKQNNDPVLQKGLDRWLTLAKDAGPFSDLEFQGLPTTIGIGSFHLLLKFILKKYADPTLPACAMSREAYEKWFATYIGFLNQAEQTIRLDPENRSSFGALSAATARSLSACLATVKKSMIDIYSDQYAMTSDMLMTFLDIHELAQFQEDAKLFDGSPNVFAGLIAVTLKKQSEMRTLESTLKLSEVRVFTREEEADDLAVRVLKKIGLDPLGNADWLVNWTLDERSKASCFDTLARDHVPAYGSLLDDHHAPCFRYYHQRQLSLWLSQSSAR